MYRQSSVKSDNKITLHFISQNVPLAREKGRKPAPLIGGVYISHLNT